MLNRNEKCINLLGKEWVRNVLLTASIWPGCVALIGGYVNSVAIYYSSSRAIAFTIVVRMLFFVNIIIRSSYDFISLYCSQLYTN